MGGPHMQWGGTRPGSRTNNASERKSFGVAFGFAVVILLVLYFVQR
jgi:hypothetical protein